MESIAMFFHSHSHAEKFWWWDNWLGNGILQYFWSCHEYFSVGFLFNIQLEFLEAFGGIQIETTDKTLCPIELQKFDF